MLAQDILYQAGYAHDKLTMAEHKLCPVQQTAPVEVKQCKQENISDQAGTYTIKLSMAGRKQCPAQQTVPIPVKQCWHKIYIYIYIVPSRYVHDNAHIGRTQAVLCATNSAYGS